MVSGKFSCRQAEGRVAVIIGTVGGIVAIAPTMVAGVSRRHRSAMLIADRAGEQADIAATAASERDIGALRELSLDRAEQVAIDSSIKSREPMRSYVLPRSRLGGLPNTLVCQRVKAPIEL